jgi:hypothetical protein
LSGEAQLAKSGAFLADGREMRVRGARPHDARPLASSLYVVGTLDGALIRSLGLERDPHPNSAHVAWVRVSAGSDRRGLGAGSALVFYERHGFAREGARRAHYRHGEQYLDEVLMARFLTPVS